MTNSKTVDKDWVVAAQWRTDTVTNDRLHISSIQFTYVAKYEPYILIC